MPISSVVAISINLPCTALFCCNKTLSIGIYLSWLVLVTESTHTSRKVLTTVIIKQTHIRPFHLSDSSSFLLL